MTSIRACVFVGTVVVVLACGVAESAPKITCDAPVYDFGRIANESNVTHCFELMNSGDSVLRITQTRTSCSACGKVAISEDVALPGQKLLLDVACTMDGRVGPYMRTVFLESNDPATPLYRVVVTGELYSTQIEPDIWTLPRVFILNVNELYPIPSHVTISVQSTKKTQFKVDCVELPSPTLQYKLLDMGTNEGWQVIVTGLSSNKNIDGKVIKVHLSGAETNMISLPVKLVR